MSRLLSAPGSSAWVLAAAMLAPFVVTASAIWLLPEGPAQIVASYGLALSDLALMVSMSGVRLVNAARRGKIAPAWMALGALPALCTALVCALIPVIDFRWAFILLMGTLAIQGSWDFGGATMPRRLAVIRPIVTVGVLIALLVGFVAY